MLNLPVLQIPLLDRMDAGEIFPVVVVTLALLTGTIISVTAIVVTNWRRFRERRMATVLIQEMLDRNLSATEIQQIMSVWGETSESAEEAARRHRRSREVPHRPPKPAKPAV